MLLPIDRQPQSLTRNCDPTLPECRVSVCCVTPWGRRRRYHSLLAAGSALSRSREGFRKLDRATSRFRLLIVRDVSLNRVRIGRWQGSASN